MTRTCAFCSTASAGYTCPRCNKDYCGLQCYQSNSHVSCSEEFYKECVTAELSGHNLSQESKEKMQAILKRMKDGEADEDNDDVEDDGLDSDDEDDIIDRLQNVNLDDPDAIWSALSTSERRQFEEMVRAGDVNHIIPEFEPFWSKRYELPKIQELDPSTDSGTDSCSIESQLYPDCPKVWDAIPAFSTLCPRAPSQFVKYGLLNLLYGYAYAVRYLYGDYETSCLHFVEVIESLAATLSGANFELADTAIEAAASLSCQHEFLSVSLEFSRSVKKDVYQILKGPNEQDSMFYVLSALSDARCQYLKAIEKLKAGDDPEKKSAVPAAASKPAVAGDNRLVAGQYVDRHPALARKEVKLHVKKIEFYLAWTKEHGVEAFQEL